MKINNSSSDRKLVNKFLFDNLDDIYSCVTPIYLFDLTMELL